LTRYIVSRQLVADLISKRDEGIKNEIALIVHACEQVLRKFIDRVVAVECCINASDSDTPTDLKLRRGEKLEDGEVIN
jgi:hypothetical protein